MRSALADSRTRYKDFVELSSDFTWETGSHGRFTFVSPAGAVGHEARALVNTDPVDLLDPSEVRAGGAVFVTRQRVQDVEMWARRRNGRLVCLLTSAMPVFDETGAWAGARGICRDITDQRDRERALNRARNREQVRAHVVRTFRDELNLENMLNVAAEALARGLGAATCHILRRPPLCPEDRDGLMLGGHFGSPSEPSRLSGILDTLDVGTPPWDTRVGDQIVLVAATSHRQMLNGAVALWRHADRGAWSEDDRLLIQDVANQVGIANEQITRHETIIAMSRTDSLTGLLNRRAFFEDIERRHKRLERTNRNASLLYVDLDNFKMVNDLHGHFRGDEALVVVGEILSSNTRPTDLVARLGGDEFALWLEDADTAAAMRKAEDLLTAGERLLDYSGAPDGPLTLSIGLAVFDPSHPETLQALTARADAAMYGAKQRGKGRLGVAPPAALPPETTEDTPSGDREAP
nr:diguanylate cyclase [Roseospira visakhapatnamensis]